MALIPFSALQAGGRADLTAKLHLAELPVHIATTVLLVWIGGVDGCALASLLCSVQDAICVVWIATRVLPRQAGLARRSSALSFVGLVALSGAALPIPLWARLAWSTCSVTLIALGAWRWYLDNYERDAARTALGLLRR
jgi:Na+-driven multidrug efflux pump